MPPAASPLSSASAGSLRTTQKAIVADLLLLGALMALALGLSIGANHLRSSPLPWSYASPQQRLQQSVDQLGVHFPDEHSPPFPPPLATDLAPAQTIDLDRFHALTEDPAALILDARPELFYRVGHVPGARLLSRAAFETDYTALRPLLESHRAATLAVYCAGGDCEDSRLVAAALAKLGYPHVVIYQGGWEEWQSAGLPEERR